MNDEQLDALVSAADEGVTCDGLSVDRDKTGYCFETPNGGREGLSKSEFRELAEANPWFVSNWYYWNAVNRPATERTLLQWLEGTDDPVPDRYRSLADGELVSSWGELQIEIGLGDDGNRLYTVRNKKDANLDLDDLEIRTDPLDARSLVKRDDCGRYRPLKTAPTLPTGWAFVDLDGRSLAETIEYVYPATVANWYLERRGELDVSHWRETMERQTGIYGVVETWDRGEGHEHVEWVAESCCVDSQCLKRREWEYDGTTELEVDGGDGVFPCREPCSLVVAAARKWTQLEGELPRTYEFELTPSEKAQLEAIVDAVADGKTEEIREADFREGANRYRARFLRAKRFDDDGRFRGVSTDDERSPENDGG